MSPRTTGTGAEEPLWETQRRRLDPGAGMGGWEGGEVEVGRGQTSATVQSESAHLNDDVKDYCPQCVKHSLTDQTAKDFFFYRSLCQYNSFIFTLFFSKCWPGLKQKLPKSTYTGRKQKQGCSSQFQCEK